MNEIATATVKLTYKEYKEFCLFQRRKAGKPKPFLFRHWVFCLIVSVIVLVVIINQNTKGHDASYLAIWFVLSILYTFFLDVGEIKSEWHGSSYKFDTYHYSFYPDSYSVDINNDGRHRHREFPYDDYLYIDRRKNVFYLHDSVREDYIVPLRCISTGTPEQLSALFKEKLGDRFEEHA